MSFKDFAAKESAAAQEKFAKNMPEVKANDILPKGQPVTKTEGESIKVPAEPKL